jgi:hypothetical protein
MAVKAKKKAPSKRRPVNRKPTMPSVEDILEHGVSQSELLTYVDCPQKRKLGLLGWQSRKVSTPLAYGTLGHDCMEALYNGVNPDRYVYYGDPQAVMDVVDGVCENNIQAHPQYSAEQRQEFEHWNVKLRVTLSEYFQYWGAKEEDRDWIGLERPIPKIPCGETFLQGKLDGVFNHSKTKIAFLDHKFKGQISEDVLIETLETDFQMMMYALSIREEFGKLPSYAIYNCIRRPGLKVTKNENLPQHEVRLREHLLANPDHYFKRFEVPFDAPAVARFEEDLHTMIAEYIAWLKAGTPTRLYGNPCNGRYGLCGYYGLCHRGDTHNYVVGEAGGYRPMK